MTLAERVILAVVVVLADVLIFVVPLTGLFAAYVLLARPPWFANWVAALYASPGTAPHQPDS